MDSDSKTPHRGNRSSKKLEIVVERRVAPSDEEIIRLQRVVRDMAHEMREMSRELDFLKCRTRDLENLQHVDRDMRRQGVRSSRYQFEEGPHTEFCADGRQLRRRLDEGAYERLLPTAHHTYKQDLIRGPCQYVMRNEDRIDSMLWSACGA